MKLVVDGVIYHLQSHGGISRLYSEILPRMCAFDELLEVTLLTSGRPKQPLPRHPQIREKRFIPMRRFLRPSRLWWRTYPLVDGLPKQLAVGGDRAAIWHSTYYTFLPKWHGPHVLTVVDMIHELFPQLYDAHHAERLRQQKHRCVSSADRVICISEATRQDVQQFYRIDASRIRVIPLGYGDAFRPLDLRDRAALMPTSKPFLLYVGQRGKHKNFSFVLQAYSHWSRQKDVELIVVGREWSGEEIQHLSRLGLMQSVHLMKKVDDRELAVLYNLATAFVYPSLYEGFGIPLLEAMACGCPIIASRVPSTLEVAGDCPIYFEPTEAEELMIGLDVALDEGRESTRVQLGLKSAKRYSWDKAAKQILQVYHELCNVS